MSRRTGPAGWHGVRGPDSRLHAIGYGGWATPAPYADVSWVYVADALYSTVVDLWHWDQALQRDTLIPQAVSAEMLAPRVATGPRGAAGCPWNTIQAQYGYGWFSGEVGGHLVIEHGGDVPGFTAMNAFVPSDGITIIVLSNQASAGARSFLGLALTQIMLGRS